MKRYFPILLLLALGLSACTIRFDIGVEVNEDESGTFALFVGFDDEFKQLAEQGGGDDLNITEGLEDVPDGWSVEEVTEDGFEGVKIEVGFNSFEDLERRLGELNETTDTGVGTDFLSGFGLTHEGDEFRFKVDVSGVDEELTGAIGEGAGDDLFTGFDLDELFQIRFKLTLPGEIGANNADLVEGNTLVWNVGLSEEDGTYEAVSTTGGGSSALLFAGIAAAGVVVVGVGATAARRRKDEAAVEAVTSAPISTEAPPINPVD